MMQVINIRKLDLGYWTKKEITIQRFEKEDGEEFLVWCNHAGAEEQIVEQNVYRPDQPDIVWTDRLMACKCGAWRNIHNDEWNDAPFEGKHYE